MSSRKKYSAEFKREAVALANQPAVTKAQIGRELGVNPNMITRWQRELSANGSKAFLGKGVARSLSLSLSLSRASPVSRVALLLLPSSSPPPPPPPPSFSR